MARLQFGEWEMKEGINLHIASKDYVAAGWEIHD